MKKPYYDCPSFNTCSSPKCPLDPECNDGMRYPEEPKCKAEKPTRIKIGTRYPELLPLKGLTSKEWAGKQIWDRKSPAAKARIIEQGAKLAKYARSCNKRKV